MNTHVRRWFYTTLLLAFPSCLNCFATSIVIRSNGKEIAIAADSKRQNVDSPVCKVQAIDDGIFVAAGDTSFVFDAETAAKLGKPALYDAFVTGPEAAIGQHEAWRMVEKFTVAIEPKLHDFILLKFMSGIKENMDFARGPTMVLDIAYVLGNHSEPVFFERMFMCVSTEKNVFILHHDTVCLGACSEPSAYAVLGRSEPHEYIRTDPSIFSKLPMDFSYSLVHRATNEIPRSVGEPIVRVTVDRSGPHWDPNYSRPCEDEAKKTAAFKAEKAKRTTEKQRQKSPSIR